MTPLHFRGERLMLDPLGAVWWPAARLLAVADLHLEKGSACAAQGHLVPPWDTHATLERLALLLRRHRPARVVALGDSFHDQHGPGRMMSGDAVRLRAMTEAVPFVWVLGNHDPALPGMTGTVTDTWAEGPFTFRHEAVQAAEGELCGHHHPKASVVTRAGTITRPCFVTDQRRLMLPSLGAYTGGLDLQHPAIAGLFHRTGRAFLLGENRLFSFALTQTVPGARAQAAQARAAQMRALSMQQEGGNLS